MLYAHVRSLTDNIQECGPADRDLLERYLTHRDEEAFSALVHRHGAMVLGTCRRLLSCEQDAEDAWQATFLLLACRGKTIRKRNHLAGWLHSVASRVARKLRGNQRHRSAEALPEMATRDAAPDVGWREVQALLDEELERLPEQYRAPILLCYLEGRTRDEAARQLGWSLATLRGRLERARERLRWRLTRRGVTLSAPLLGASLVGPASAAEVPTLMTVSAVRAAVQLSEGAALGSIVSGRIVTLMEGVIQAMCWTKAKLAAVLLLGVCLAGLSAGLLAQTGSDTGEPFRRKPPPKGPDLEQRVAELEKQLALLKREVEILRRPRGKVPDKENVENTNLIVPLRAAAASHAAKVLREALGEKRSGLTIAVDDQTNSLIVTASALDLMTIKRILEKIDVPGDSEKARPVLKTYTLKAAKAEGVSRALQQLFKDRDIRVASISSRSIVVSCAPADADLVEALVSRIDSQISDEEREERKDKPK
jgi:RNA polymerase sigma factor (sigma-70 family)